MINKNMYKTFGMQKGAVSKTKNNEILQGVFLFLFSEIYLFWHTNT